jgi:hypothetical protein
MDAPSQSSTDIESIYMKFSSSMAQAQPGRASHLLSTWLGSLSVACSAWMCATVAQAQQVEQDGGQWFVLGSLHQLAGTSTPVTLNMGGPVVLEGQQQLGEGPGISLSVGKQFTSYEEGAATKAWRVEAQALTGSFKRTSASVSTLEFNPDDKVQANVLLLNVSWQLAKSEEVYGPGESPLWRTWLGVGLGVANVSVPKPAALVGGCSCFNAASGSGWAYQLKLSVERKISADNWFLQGQIARLGLSAVSTAGSNFPQTRYGAISTNVLSFGVLKLF